MRALKAVGVRKSIGVFVTGANCPVGMSPLLMGKNRLALI
jgi:hypothetical protein